MMKSARFNAAKRFERKHSASTLSFAVAGIVGFLVPVYPLVLKNVSAHATQVLEFTSFVTGALSITLGLYDLGKNYPERARQFHECGKAINRVVRRLDTVISHAQLGSLIEDYERAIDGCSENHDSIDYEIARLQWELKLVKGGERAQLTRSLRRLKRVELLQTCWLYGLIWITPLVVGGLLLWWEPVMSNMLRHAAVEPF